MPIQKTTKVRVTLSIEDVMALIEYHERMYRAIPEKLYSTRNSAGTTFKDTAEKYIEKRSKFLRILEETWPK